MWKLINQDYLIDSDNTDEEEDLTSIFPLFNSINFPSPPELPSTTTATVNSVQDINAAPSDNHEELKEILTNIQTDIKVIKDNQLSSINQVETENVPRSDTLLENLKQCFKCPLCYELNLKFVSCTRCNRFVSCTDCMTNNEITRCPLCRNEFDALCTNCNTRFFNPPAHVTINGLEDVLSVRED